MAINTSEASAMRRLLKAAEDYASVTPREEPYAFGDAEHIRAMVDMVERIFARIPLIGNVLPGKDGEAGSGIRRIWERQDGEVLADVTKHVLVDARVESAILALRVLTKSAAPRAKAKAKSGT